MSVKVLKLVTGERIIAFCQAVDYGDGFPLLLLNNVFEYAKESDQYKLTAFPPDISEEDDSLTIEPSCVAYAYVPTTDLLSVYNNETGRQNVVAIKKA